MNEIAPPTNVGSNDGLGLVPCALCGEDKGYILDAGSTYRWWSVKCAACGQEVAEARANNPAETTLRTARADDAWRNAGAHAAGLRGELQRLKESADAVLREAQFYVACYGATPRCEKAIETLAQVLRPNVEANRL